MNRDFSLTETEMIEGKSIGPLKQLASWFLTLPMLLVTPIISAIIVFFAILTIHQTTFYSQVVSCIALIITSSFLGFYWFHVSISRNLKAAWKNIQETNEFMDFIADENGTEEEIVSIEGSGVPALDEFVSKAETVISLPEKKLSQLEEEFEIVLNNIAAAVILYDTEGKPRLCSSYIEVLTGYSLEELQSAEEADFLRTLILDEDWERYKRARAVSHLGEDTIVRFQIRHSSGLLLWLESRMVPIMNIAGDITSVMSVLIDVSDSINYQKQIEQQNQDLSDFAYMVSHDLKAPVFTIHGMASALKDDLGNDQDENTTQLLDFIIDAAERLDKLVASVLEYSALTNANETPSEVDLNETLGQVISDHSEILKGVDHQFTIDENLPITKADPIRVYQIFSNLVGNAIKYRDPSRPLDLQVSAEIIPPQSVEIKVKDNGLGIPKNKIEEVFRPYRRAHGADIEGSGIGLACVKKIVERLGGEVGVESTEGIGSTFSVELPLARSTRKPPPEDIARLF